MDIAKINTRSQLNRMVWNYYLLGRIEEAAARGIIAYIDASIGGGELETKDCGKVIIFPQGTPNLEPQTPSNKEPEYVDEELEKILSAGGWILSHSLPRIGIRTIEDCKDVTIDRLKKIRGIGEIKSKKLFECLKAAYDSYTREKQDVSEKSK